MFAILNKYKKLSPIHKCMVDQIIIDEKYTLWTYITKSDFYSRIFLNLINLVNDIRQLDVHHKSIFIAVHAAIQKEIIQDCNSKTRPVLEIINALTDTFERNVYTYLLCNNYCITI